MLDELGFVTINPASMSLRDQLVKFSNCKVLVIQAGAALANMAFMPSGSVAVVLALDSQHVHYDYFEQYGKIFEVSVIYIKCRSATPNKYRPEAIFTISHPTNHDLACDLNLFRRIVMDAVCKINT
jgi:capsular polysaccharide biosynthesis protein